MVERKKIVGWTFLGLFILFLAGLFYVVFLPLKPGLSASLLSYQIGQFLGLAGFFFIALLIISGDLARFFDKYFGLDRIIKTQRKFALVTYFVVIFHPIFIILSGFYGISYLLPQFSAVPLAVGAIAIYIFIAIMVSSLLYKRISYRIWQYLHVLTYLMFVFVLGHGFLAGSSSGSPIVKIVYGSMLVLVLVGLVYRARYKLAQRKNKFYVQALRKETADTFTLVLKPSRKVEFKPGQFFFLRLEGKRLFARHPFSVSSAPSSKNLEFTIKLAGRFTKSILELKKGEEVKVEGPFGNFVLEDDGLGKVFIAAGVGITPFMSMIKQLEEKKHAEGIDLIYGSRTEKDIIFRKKINSIRKLKINKVYVLSREKKIAKGYEHGRIGRDLLVKSIRNLKDKRYYICGPKEMNERLEKDLLELGVARNRIKYEDFFW